MPYGIKNKTKQWEKTTKAGNEIDSKIEACVNRLLGDKNFKPRNGEDKKTAAIKVCKATIMRSSEIRKKLG